MSSLMKVLLLKGCGTPSAPLNTLYTGDMNSSPGRVFKVSYPKYVENATYDTLELGVGEDNVQSMIIIDGYLYIGLQTEPGMLVKIDLSNFQEIDALPFPAGYNYAYCLAYWNGYLFVGTALSPPGDYRAGVVKVNLSSFSVEATNVLATKGVGVMDMTIHNYGGVDYLYCVPFWVPGSVDRIDPDVFLGWKTQVFPAGHYYTYSLVGYGDYIYIACGRVGVGEVIRTHASLNFAASYLALAAGEDEPRMSIKQGQYDYIGLARVPGMIVKVDMPSFSEVDALTFSDPDEQRSYGLAIDSKNQLFVGCDVDPWLVGRLVQIDLPPFSQVSSFTFAEIGLWLRGVVA